MKTIIVGAGFTGIAAALFAKKIGLNNIYIYEKTNSIGGIIKDFNVNNEISFLRNCQYLDPKSPIFDVVDKNLFYEFKHSSGTFSKFDENLIVRNDFGGPVFDSKGEDISLDINLRKDDVNSYFDAYPPSIRSELKQLFSRMADGNHIHNSCLYSLQLHRIFVQDKVNYIRNLKKKSIDHDKFYGLPRSILELDDSFSCLPIGGYDQLFGKVKKQLKDLDIKIKFSANLTPLFEKNSFTLKIKDKIINSNNDLIIWTADPNKFLLMDKDPLKYKPLQMINYYFKIDNIIDSPFYVQVYDVKTPILRVFIYENSVVIEALKNNLSEKDILSKAKTIISKFDKNLIGKDYIPNKIFSKNELRFTLFGSEIYKKLRYLNEKSFSEYNLLLTPWHLYGRDIRIYDIFEKLKLVKEQY